MKGTSSLSRFLKTIYQSCVCLSYCYRHGQSRHTARRGTPVSHRHGSAASLVWEETQVGQNPQISTSVLLVPSSALLCVHAVLSARTPWVFPRHIEDTWAQCCHRRCLLMLLKFFREALTLHKLCFGPQKGRQEFRDFSCQSLALRWEIHPLGGQKQGRWWRGTTHHLSL